MIYSLRLLVVDSAWNVEDCAAGMYLRYQHKRVGSHTYDVTTYTNQTHKVGNAHWALGHDLCRLEDSN